jgi:hypothetical protein
MFKFLKKLFVKKQVPSYISCRDQNFDDGGLAACALMCLSTGKTVIGQRSSDGVVTMKVLEGEEK